MHIPTGVTHAAVGVSHIATVAMQSATVVMHTATVVTHAAMVVMREETVGSPRPAGAIQLPVAPSPAQRGRDGVGAWKIAASRSIPSTSRGPGRLKQPLASTGWTRPSRTARSALQLIREEG